MEQGNSNIIPANAVQMQGKSWTAYLPIAMGAVIAMVFLSLLSGVISQGVIVVGTIMSISYIAYQIMLVRSYRLFYDDLGIWVYHGILPWTKVTTGVKWRDLDEAIYLSSFWSWLFKSYTIRIGHRFTKASEILLSHMAGGKETVIAINERHRSLVQSGAL